MGSGLLKLRSPAFGREQSGGHFKLRDLRPSLALLEFCIRRELLGAQKLLRLGEKLPVELLLLPREGVEVVFGEQRRVIVGVLVSPA